MTSIDRRTLLSRSALAAGAATLASGSLTGLLARAAGAAPGGAAVGSQAANKDGSYGPLVNRGDLWLPQGFRYVAFGQMGTPLPLTRGGVPAGTLPRGHDGMASFAAGPGLVRLVRNHENRTEASPLGGGGYNPAPLWRDDDHGVRRGRSGERSQGLEPVPGPVGQPPGHQHKLRRGPFSMGIVAHVRGDGRVGERYPPRVRLRGPVPDQRARRPPTTQGHGTLRSRGGGH